MAMYNMIHELIVISCCASNQSFPVDSEAVDSVEKRFGLMLGGTADLEVARAAMQTILNEMPEDDIRRIHALMYSGRDGDDAKAVKEHFHGRAETLADLRRTILEKIIALGLYLTKGLERAEADGLDIGNF